MGIARGKTDRVDARRIAEYAITHYRKIALYLPAEKELCQLRTWLILRAHLAKQRVAKLVLLEKLDYKEKFADVSIQRSMLQEEIAYAETHMKTIEREMKELITADSNICRNYKLLTSIKGVGPITAIVMLCSTLNFTKITDHRKFACQIVFIKVQSSWNFLFSAANSEPCFFFAFLLFFSYFLRCLTIGIRTVRVPEIPVIYSFNCLVMLL